MSSSSTNMVSNAPGEETTAYSLFPKRSLLETRDKNSFVRNIDLIIQYISPELVQSEELLIPEQITRLKSNVENGAKRLNSLNAEYHWDSVWDDAELLLKSLEDNLAHVRSATRELRQYIPETGNRTYPHSRTPSLESLESVVPEKEACAHVLRVAVQSGYEVSQERFNDCVRLVRQGLEGELPVIETAAASGVARVSRTIALLDSLVEFETESHGLDENQFALTISQQLLKDRQQALVDLFHAFCIYLMHLHESFFLMQHLLAKGSAAIQRLRGMAEMMMRYWIQASDVMKRMTRTCPMFTEVAHEYYGRALWHAASNIAVMQDGDDVQQFVENAKGISYEVEVVRDITRSQLWLLTCIEQLRSLVSHHVCRLKQQQSHARAPSKLNRQLLQDLKKVMYDLVMVTIARSSWLNSYPEQTPLTLLKDLRHQGTRTFQLVSKYSRCKVGLQCDRDSTVQDVSLYSALVCATNVLRNDLLRVHSVVERRDAIPEEPEQPVVPEELLGDGGCVRFHQVCGFRRLKADISIKPHPVTLDGSIEFEQALKQLEEEQGPLRGSADLSDLMTSPWETDFDSATDDEEQRRHTRTGSCESLPSPSQNLSPSHQSSVASIELSNAFLDIEDSNSGEVDSAFMTDTAPRRDPMSLPSFHKSSSPDKSSPFETQQPSEQPSAPTSGWGSRTLSDKEPSAAESSSGGVVSVVSSGLVKDVLAVDLVPGPMIGKGSEGHVLQMSYHTTPVAVKIMNHTSHRTRERFKNETKLLSKLSCHENIVTFVGQCKDLRAGEQNLAADLVMVMELCDLGNLYKIISEAKYPPPAPPSPAASACFRWIGQLDSIGRNLKNYKEFFGYLLYTDWKRRLEVARDVAAGAAHMHRHGIVHRDLTSFNVILKRGENEGDWIAKICDFERSRHIPENSTIPRSDNMANSPAWSAPEVLREDPYSVQADVFSFGVILWELWTLEEPWKHPEQELRNPLLIIPKVGNGARLEIPSASPAGHPHLPALRALIQDCWCEDPSARPTMEQVHQRLTQMIANMTKTLSA